MQVRLRVAATCSTPCARRVQGVAAAPSGRAAAAPAATAATKNSAGGFGKSNKKRVDTSSSLIIPSEGKRVKARDLALDDASERSTTDGAENAAPRGFPDGWVDLKLTTAQVAAGGKPVRPVELATGRTLMLYSFEGNIYVSDAASTAYQYPLVDAKLAREPDSGRVTVEVPLDGTVYELSTGAVIKWCPRDNPVRNLLGTLKARSNPVPLPVYPVYVTSSGDIWTKLV